MWYKTYSKVKKG